MYTPIDLPKRKPKLRPYHYDLLAECKTLDVNFAIELTETLIEAIYTYATTDYYQRSHEIFLWISDSILGDGCYSFNFARRYSPKDCCEYTSLECWDDRNKDFIYFLNLSDNACTYLRFMLDNLPDLYDIIDYVLRVDEMIATEIDMVLQAREDIIEMRALVYGEGW